MNTYGYDEVPIYTLDNKHLVIKQKRTNGLGDIHNFIYNGFADGGIKELNFKIGSAKISAKSLFELIGGIRNVTRYIDTLKTPSYILPSITWDELGKNSSEIETLVADLKRYKNGIPLEKN